MAHKCDWSIAGGWVGFPIDPVGHEVCGQVVGEYWAGSQGQALLNRGEFDAGKVSRKNDLFFNGSAIKEGLEFKAVPLR